MDFVCRLKESMDRPTVLTGIVDALHSAGFDVQSTTLEHVKIALQRNYIKNTRVIEL